MAVKQVLLPANDIPRQWYNILADIKMNPPLGPDGNPVGPDDLAPVFPMNIIEQEVSTDRWIDIPEPVLDVLAIWRPAPLIRADRLEKALDTPARIYYKYEGGSPPGSHKPNTAVARSITTKFSVSKTLPPRPAPASGAVRSLLPAPSSASIAKFTWCASASTRSRTGKP